MLCDMATRIKTNFLFPQMLTPLQMHGQHLPMFPASTLCLSFPWSDIFGDAVTESDSSLTLPSTVTQLGKPSLSASLTLPPLKALSLSAAPVWLQFPPHHPMSGSGMPPPQRKANRLLPSLREPSRNFMLTKRHYRPLVS